MSLGVYARALVRVEHEGVHGGVVGDEVVLADGQLHVLHKGAMMTSLPLTGGVRVLHPPGTPRPLRLALAEGTEVAISACDAAADLLFVLQHHHHTGGTNTTNTDRGAFFGRVHCSDAAVRLRRAATELPPAVYGPFPKLVLALELLACDPSTRNALTVEQNDGGDDDSSADQWRLWSRECARGNGAREYYVASVPEFWRWLVRDPEGLYEVIRDDTPTRFFLDIEYEYSADSAAHTGRERVAALLQLLSTMVPGPARPCVALESEYPHKFSQHIIVPTLVLQSLRDCGRLVAALHGHARARALAGDADADKCFVRAIDSVAGVDEKKFICDLGVYNRNRNFRLVYSSKRGKNAPLRPVGAESDPMDYAVFLSSLIAPVVPSRDVLTWGDDGDVAAQSEAKARKRAKQMPDGLKAPPGGTTSKATDDFVRSIIAGAGGYVRAVTVSGERVMYSIAGGYRYCANVGRHHKSNNVYFLADLRTNKLYQRCHDGDCAGFESAGVDIPGRFIEAAVARGELPPDDAFLAALEEGDPRVDE